MAEPASGGAREAGSDARISGEKVLSLPIVPAASRAAGLPCLIRHNGRMSVWVTVLGQGVILAVAVLGFLSTRQGVRKVHKLVNNQLDRQLLYNQQLAATLTKAGVPVPPQEDGHSPVA
jgi:hypothetical protein